MKIPLSDALASIFFPRRCFGCKTDTARLSGASSSASSALCGGCRGKITIARTLFCGECGGHLFNGKPICHPDFPYILGAAAKYDDPALQALVQALKFRGTRRAVEPLASIIKEYLVGVGMRFDGFTGFTVVPVPLSRERLRSRGFNQAELLARPVAAYLGLPLDASTLVRIRHTKPQTEMKSSRERRENLRGCFLARAPLAGGNILLVDDVTTTGTTFLEASRTLKRVGAGTIIALAALRA
jgi:ComF family protein